MKVYIIFLGLFLMNMGFITYQEDLSDMNISLAELKAAAEEAAERGASFYDAEAYSEGYYIFNREEGLKSIDAYLAALPGSKGELGKAGIKSISYTVTFSDDSGCSYIYEDGRLTTKSNMTAEIPHYPSVLAELRVETEDYFSASYLETSRLTRSALYEVKGTVSEGVTDKIPSLNI